MKLTPYTGDITFRDGYVWPAKQYHIKHERNRYYYPTTHPAYGGKRKTFPKDEDAIRWLAGEMTRVADAHNWDIVAIENEPPIPKYDTLHVWRHGLGAIWVQTKQAYNTLESSLYVSNILLDMNRRSFTTPHVHASRLDFQTTEHTEETRLLKVSYPTLRDKWRNHIAGIPARARQILPEFLQDVTRVPLTEITNILNDGDDLPAFRYLTQSVHETLHDAKFTKEEIAAIEKFATVLNATGYPVTISKRYDGLRAFRFATQETLRDKLFPLRDGPFPSQFTEHDHGHVINIDVANRTISVQWCGLAHQKAFLEQQAKQELRNTLNTIFAPEQPATDTTIETIYPKGRP